MGSDPRIVASFVFSNEVSTRADGKRLSFAPSNFDLSERMFDLNVERRNHRNNHMGNPISATPGAAFKEFQPQSLEKTGEFAMYVLFDLFQNINFKSALSSVGVLIPFCRFRVATGSTLQNLLEFYADANAYLCANTISFT
jgi:hypothetical protein